MIPRTILYRIFTTCIAALGLIAAGWASADPPSRVARLSFTQGVVSFSPAGDDGWVRALLNRPLVRGDRLWTDNDARAELQIGVGAVRLAEYTSVSLLDISDRITQLQLAQGTLSVRVRHLRSGEAVEIATPNLAFAIERPGEYTIAVDPRGEATTIVVRSGQGQVFGDGVAYDLRDQETVRFYGTDLADHEVLAFDAPDPFERWVRGRERRVDQAIAARYVAPEVIGYEDLDAYGSWRSAEGYGAVWTPRSVAADWAPYSTGHWSWIEPYGWTWVDDAPWGFAPYHYGRWAHIRGAWSWVPGPRTVRPVYAPALVAFVGGSNFRVSVSSGPATAGIAWFPLAPGEVYRPAYNVTQDYFRNVNISNTVVNNTYITNVYNQTDVTEVNYRNRQVNNAITAVPTVAFAQSQPVHRVAMPVNREAVARAQVMTSLAVAPTLMSMTGGAPPAAQKPAADVLRRTAVVREAPPPVTSVAPAPQRMQAQQPLPGRAVERAPAAVSPANPAPAPNVRVVGAETPKPMLMRSRDGEGRRGMTPGVAGSAPAAPSGAMQPGAAPLAPRAAPPAMGQPAAAPPPVMQSAPGVAPQRAAPPAAGVPGAIAPAPAAVPPAPAAARPQDPNERRREERREERRPATAAPLPGDAPRAMQPGAPGPAVAAPPALVAPRAMQPGTTGPAVAAPSPVAPPTPSIAPARIDQRDAREPRGNAERERRERDPRREVVPAPQAAPAPAVIAPPSPQPPAAPPAAARPAPPSAPLVAPQAQPPVARPAPPVPVPAQSIAPPAPQPVPNTRDLARDRGDRAREQRGNAPMAAPQPPAPPPVATPAPPAPLPPAALPPGAPVRPPQAVAPAGPVPQPAPGAAPAQAPKQDGNLQRRDRRDEDKKDGDKDGKKEK